MSRDGNQQRKGEYDEIVRSIREGGGTRAPGKSTRAPLARKAADGNGVAPDADAAVASAGASTGAPLPAGLQRKFESSLGADLSGVRVHTGESSAGAAASVSARAYTLGSDIHFNRGQYDPHSLDGERLLAHEVAHTVQQSGGAAHGAQFKLEVSTPGDAAEVEADRAADAMVGGAAAHVSGHAGVARQVVMRDVTDVMHQQADAMETATPDQGTLGGRALGVSVVGDIAAARQLRDQLDAVDSDLESAIARQDVPADARVENEAAKRVLDEYLMQAGVQSSTLSTFQSQFLRFARDKARLDQMIQSYAATSRGSALGAAIQQGQFGGEHGGTQFGDALVGSLGIGGGDRARLSHLGDGGGSVNLMQAQDYHRDMVRLGGLIGVRQSDYLAQQSLAQAAGHAMAAGLPVLATPDAQRHYQELQARVTRMVGYVSAVVGFAASKAGGIAGTAATAALSGIVESAGIQGETADHILESASGSAESHTTDFVTEFLNEVAQLPWAGELAAADGHARASLQDQAYHSYQAQVQTFNSARQQLVRACQEFLTTAQEFETTKRAYRQAMARVGQAADGGRGRGGERYAILAAILAEADTVVAQGTAVQALGASEQTAAQGTEGARGAAQGQSVHHLWQGGESYNIPRRIHHDVGGFDSWVVDQYHVSINGSPRSPNAVAGVANPTVDQTLVQVRAMVTSVTQIRDRLSREFDSVLTLGSTGTAGSEP